MDVSRKHGIVRVSPLTINPVTHNGYKKNDFEIPATRKCQSVMNVLKDDCVNGSSQIHHHIGKSVFQFKLNARILVLPNKYQYRKKPVKETTEVHSQDNQNGLALLERYSLEFALLKAYSID